MPDVTITVSDELVAELNEIAQDLGYPNAKAMVVGYLRQAIVKKRRNTASLEAEPSAQQEAETGIG